MRRLLENLGFLLLINLISKPLWLLAEQEVQDRLGHATWGTFAALLSLGFLLRPVGELGIAQYTIKTIAGEQRYYNSLFGRALLLKLWLNVLYLGVTVGVGWLLGYRGEWLLILTLVALFYVVLNFLEQFRAGLQAFQQFKTDGIASITDKTLMMLILLLMFSGGWLTLRGFAVASLLTMLLSMLAFGAVVFIKFGLPTLKLSRLRTAHLLRKSWPFALMVVLFGTNERVNQLMLERLGSGYENGLYVAAYRWIAAIQMYLWTILPVFYAKFAANLRHPVATRQNLFKTGQALVYLPLLFAFGFIWFYGDKLFFLFDNSGPEVIAEMTLNLRILAGFMWFNAAFTIFSTYLTATGHERFVSVLLIVVIALSVIANFIFIPIYGAVAASWAMTGAFGVLSLGYVIGFVRLTELRVPWLLLGKHLLITAVFLTDFWWLHSTGLHWLAVCGINAGLLIGSALALKLVDWRAAVD